jgi:hypothetical protein
MRLLGLLNISPLMHFLKFLNALAARGFALHQDVPVFSPRAGMALRLLQ